MPYKLNPFTGNFDIVNPSLTNPLQLQGSIAASSDFPTTSDVETGWYYYVTSDVTDNDGTKTNTGQSFKDGDEIAWTGSAWLVIGNENIYVPYTGATDDVDLGSNSLTTLKLTVTNGTNLFVSDPANSLLVTQDASGDVDSTSDIIVLGGGNIVSGTNNRFSVVVGEDNLLDDSTFNSAQNQFVFGRANEFSGLFSNNTVFGIVNEIDNGSRGIIIGSSNYNGMFSNVINTLIGFKNQLGSGGFEFGEYNVIIGNAGKINSGNNQILISLNSGANQASPEFITLSTPDSFLVGAKQHGSTQQDLLHAELDKGVRIGAVSGETITMSGEDLYVKGQVELHGLTKDIETITSTDTLDANNDVVICSGTFTLNLPAAASYTGKEYIIKNKGTGTITVDANGSETIDGSTTAVLSNQYESITIISDGTEWWIL